MRKLKVWGGMTFHKNKQVRAIIATRTKKEAIAKLNMSASHFNNYWCETGNDLELTTAIAKEGVVFVASRCMGNDFIEI